MEASLQSSFMLGGISEQDSATATSLLTVIADLILEAGNPLICAPYMTSLFQQAAATKLSSAPDDLDLPVCFSLIPNMSNFENLEICIEKMQVIGDHV